MERSERQDMAISFKKIKARLLANPEVKAHYDLLSLGGVFRKRYQIQPIQTEEAHRAALAEIEVLWGAPKGTKEGDKLDTLLALVDIYEAKRWPLETNEG